MLFYFQKLSIFNFQLLTFFLLFLASCNFNNPITVDNPPLIHLDSESGIYSTKIGRTITIAPTYDYVTDAIYTWSINDSIIGINPSLEFTGEELGSVFITLKVENEFGSDEEEIRVDVVEREIPTVSLVGADKGYTVSMGEELTLRASVRQTSLPTTYSWIFADSVVSDSLQYTFVADSIGVFNLMFRAENEDGADSISTTVEVVALPPIFWTFTQTEYQLIAGRSIEIGPVQTENLDGATFRFAIGDSIVQEGESSTWFCSLAQEGEYLIDITATLVRGNQVDSLYQQVSLKVISSETLYYRPKTALSQSKFNRVYEYTPAPGQFINEKKTGGFDDTQTTQETACAYAENRLNTSNWVSLGGFGGYIVVGFDHSIDNTGDYDFGVLGNSFSGSSEPGIVWVMQDENGDGLPNDNWYELRGSETGKDSTIQNYAVTYYRPSAPQMPVQWTDNQGNSGEIDYLIAYHQQDYYYPLWIEEDTYTLRGTCLAPRTYDRSGKGTYWVNGEFDWGYVDNFSPTDRLTNDMNNYFKISDAMDAQGNPVDLKYIDFVKVQTGVNVKAGWLGENSTEVVGFFDYNMIK